MFKLKYLPHRQPGEKIIFFLHRHWFVLARIIVSYVLFAIVPLVAYLFIKKEFVDLLESGAALIFFAPAYFYFLSFLVADVLSFLFGLFFGYLDCDKSSGHKYRTKKSF
ncbi:MAG: hypothetical protein ABIJ91_04125 [Candidatus Kuenenbacteria bacterium]